MSECFSLDSSQNLPIHSRPNPLVPPLPPLPLLPPLPPLPLLDSCVAIAFFASCDIVTAFYTFLMDMISAGV